MTLSRKAAIQAYKERKAPRGIFAMRCRASGKVWVDSAMDLEAAENRMWFSLRFGGAHVEKTILTEFQVHGRDQFSYEILEKLADDVAPMALRDLLKERKLHWLAELGAEKLSPV
jgi:hypothetical protein